MTLLPNVSSSRSQLMIWSCRPLRLSLPLIMTLTLILSNQAGVLQSEVRERELAGTAGSPLDWWSSSAEDMGTRRSPRSS